MKFHSFTFFAFASTILVACNAFTFTFTFNKQAELTSPVAFSHSRVPFATTLSSSSSDGSNEAEAELKKPMVPPLILPSDPKYSTHGPIGQGTFIISREGEPTAEELSNENILEIVNLNNTDLETNTLVWKGLGYRFDPVKEEWDNSKVFPKWKDNFPTPPDLIGMQRIYTKEIDQPSLKSNQQLVRSVPVESKQSLKTHLRPLGFKGYKVC